MSFRIFLAEDNLDDVFLLTRAVKKRFDVLHAANGEQACKLLLTEAPPDLFLIDLKMPFRNGFEVTECIRSHPELNKLGVVILSSSAEERDVRAAYAAGADLFICKPNTGAGYERLVDVLEERLRNRKPVELKVLQFEPDGAERWWQLEPGDR